MSCFSVTGHQDCHWTNSMVIIWCHAIQKLVVKNVIELFQWSLYDVMLFSNWSSRLPLNSIKKHSMMLCISVTGHKDCHWTHSMGLYRMSCNSVTGHKDCHWTHSLVIIWCHAIQLLVIKIVIELIQWSLYDVMLFKKWSSRLSFNSFNGHYMISCYSVTGHQDCHWTQSMVIIWCHEFQ